MVACGPAQIRSWEQNIFVWANPLRKLNVLVWVGTNPLLFVWADPIRKLNILVWAGDQGALGVLGMRLTDPYAHVRRAAAKAVGEVRPRARKSEAVPRSARF